jgi:hypothetical protein
MPSGDEIIETSDKQKLIQRDKGSETSPALSRAESKSVIYLRLTLCFDEQNVSFYP